VETLLQHHSCSFSQSINVCGLTLSAVTVLLHCLTRSLRSTVKCKQNVCYRNTKLILEGLWPCNCYVIKTNSGTIRSQLSHLPLQAKEDACVNYKLIIAWHRNSEPGACAVSVLYWQVNCRSKNQIKYLEKAVHFRISRHFWSLISISSGSKCPFSPADAHDNGHNHTQNSIMFIITFKTILNDKVGY